MFQIVYILERNLQIFITCKWTWCKKRLLFTREALPCGAVRLFQCWYLSVIYQVLFFLSFSDGGERSFLNDKNWKYSFETCGNYQNQNFKELWLYVNVCCFLGGHDNWKQVILVLTSFQYNTFSAVSYRRLIVLCVFSLLLRVLDLYLDLCQPVFVTMVPLSVVRD